MSDREDLAREIFGGERPVEPEVREKVEAEVSVEQPAEPAETKEQLAAEAGDSEAGGGHDEVEADPWEGVSPAIKQQFEQLNSKLAGIEELGNRLRTTEGRVGAIQSELAKKGEAPTKKEIKEAKTDEEWDNLKELYPEWADATDRRIAAMRADIEDKIPKFNGKIPTTEDIAFEIEKRLTSFKHPDYMDIVQSQDFANWLQSQPEETRRKTASKSSADAIFVLDKFKESRTQKKTEDKAKRLQQHETVRGTPRKPTKSEDDMTEAELRQHLAKQMW